MSVIMQSAVIHAKTRAIVCVGPATDMTGTRIGSYFQVVIDPDMASPGGDYIRFDAHNGDEIHGWQRIDALTICEVLQEDEPVKGIPPITMRAIVKE